MKPSITQAQLQAVLSYDPQSGAFTWLETRGSIKAGQLAGYAKRGYVAVNVFNGWCTAHRLAWLWMTGEWPTSFVDHRDGNGLNNSWANLRLATLSQNAANMVLSKRNKSGFKGVSFNKAVGRWQAGLKHKGRSYHLGLHDTPEQAHAAYLEKAKEIFGEFARAA